MRLTDFKYSFSGSLTMTEFLLFSMIILQDLGMMNRYVGEMLNQILKKVHNSNWWTIMAPPLLIFICHHRNTYSWQLRNTNSTQIMSSLQQQLFLWWTHNSIFLDGLLDIFQVYGKTWSNRQTASFLSVMAYLPCLTWITNQIRTRIPNFMGT